jgi:hypothetical protein
MAQKYLTPKRGKWQDETAFRSRRAREAHRTTRERLKAAGRSIEPASLADVLGELFETKEEG